MLDWENKGGAIGGNTNGTRAGSWVIFGALLYAPGKQYVFKLVGTIFIQVFLNKIEIITGPTHFLSGK